MAAPRDLTLLAKYVDELEVRISQQLEEFHHPIFPIWAEENGALGATTYEWSFGDGYATPNGNGIVIPFRCQLIALSLMLNGASARAKVDVEVDGTVKSAYAIDLTASNHGYQEFPKPLEIHAGARFNFRTVSQTSTAAGNLVCAWMRKE